MTTTTLAVLVPLLPFLGALAGLLLGRTAPGFVRPLAVLPALASLALAATVAARQGGGAPVDAATELTPTGSVPVELALHIDGFAAPHRRGRHHRRHLRADLLHGLSARRPALPVVRRSRLAVHLSDAAGRLHRRPDGAAGRLGSHGHLLLLPRRPLLGDPEARAASLKAFLVTKLGDVPFLIGLFALAADAGSFRITRILGAVADGGIDHPTLIALLLLAGVVSKSAQFPLHTWLPDAMAGPTPVSALIHAATMVAA